MTGLCDEEPQLESYDDALKATDGLQCVYRRLRPALLARHPLKSTDSSGSKKTVHPRGAHAR